MNAGVSLAGGMRAAGGYVHRERWSPRGTWSGERVIAALKDWTYYTGSAPRSYEWAPATAAVLGLNSARATLWARQYPRWPSTTTVCGYFGRWTSALEAAGLEPHRRIAPGADRAARVRAAQRMARDGIATSEIAAILEISPRTVRAYLNASECADCGTPVITSALCPACAARRATKPSATRAEIVGAIRAWKDETGEVPRVEDWTPSRDPDSKWAAEYPRWPSNMTVRTHFGGWAQALEAAGYSAGRLAWSRASIIEALRSVGRERPTTRDLERPGMPAPATVRKHFGSFAAAVEIAGLAPKRRRWRREEILDAVAAFRERHGRLPSERDWGSSSAGHPHASTARQQFGSWRELMTAYAERCR